MTNDLINGIFELGMACMLSRSVILLYKHKTVKGVSVLSIIWPTLWGFWNLYYYPSLGQRLSFYAGIAVVTINTIWIIMAFYYKHLDSHQDSLSGIP